MANLPPKAKLKKITKAVAKKEAYKKDGIQSRVWKDLRKSYLSKYPICQRCEHYGTINKNSVKNISVHHIKPRELYPDLMLEESNLLSLCNYCHYSHFSKMEMYGKLEESIQEGMYIKKCACR